MQILENIQTLSDFLTKETYLILENRFRNKPRPIRRTVYKVSTDLVKKETGLEVLRPNAYIDFLFLKVPGMEESWRK